MSSLASVVVGARVSDGTFTRGDRLPECRNVVRPWKTLDRDDDSFIVR
jgi:hypothetical protein